MTLDKYIRRNLLELAPLWEILAKSFIIFLSERCAEAQSDWEANR